MNDAANGSSALAGSHAAVPDAATGSETHQPSNAWSLALGSIGVVYGDIGTSPLYAFREAVNASGPLTRDTVLGVLSLILWALIIVVTLKYVLADRACDQGAGATDDARLPARVDWRRNVPRRLDDHPGNLGAVGG